MITYNVWRCLRPSKVPLGTLFRLLSYRDLEYRGVGERSQIDFQSCQSPQKTDPYNENSWLCQLWNRAVDPDSHGSAFNDPAEKLEKKPQKKCKAVGNNHNCICNWLKCSNSIWKSAGPGSAKSEYGSTALRTTIGFYGMYYFPPCRHCVQFTVVIVFFLLSWWWPSAGTPIQKTTSPFQEPNQSGTGTN